MKIVYWVGGVVLASVIGYFVWKMLAAKEAARVTQEMPDAKILTPDFDKPKPKTESTTSIAQRQALGGGMLSNKKKLSIGNLGNKKGF